MVETCWNHQSKVFIGVCCSVSLSSDCSYIFSNIYIICHEVQIYSNMTLESFGNLRNDHKTFFVKLTSMPHTWVPSRLRWIPVANRSDGKLCRAQGVSVVARAIGWPGNKHKMHVENELICQWLKANFLENSDSLSVYPTITRRS